MFYYNKQMVYMAVFCPVYGVAIWFLTSQYASIELLSMLQACVIPLLLISRVCTVCSFLSPQVSHNLKFSRVNISQFCRIPLKIKFHG